MQIVREIFLTGKQVIDGKHKFTMRINGQYKGIQAKDTIILGGKTYYYLPGSG